MDGQSGLFPNNGNTFAFDERPQVPAKIVVLGLGGIGIKSINRLVEAQIPGVEFIAVDTDKRELRNSRASIKLEIGMNIATGSGCGGDPKLGRKIVLEEAERILDLFKGLDMIFILGGEGGGTFTGGAPIFAGLAAEIGALSIAMATMPFSLQGLTRRQYAETGFQELKEAADVLIAVSNEHLYGILDKDVLLEDSFSFAERVFCDAIRDLAELITKPGILRLELSDVRAIMQQRRVNLIGMGIAEGPNRASDAVQSAIANPLLKDMPITQAKSVLINVSSSRQSLRLHEAKSAAKAIEEQASLEDMVIGAMYDDSMGDRLKVTVIASGPIRNTSEQFDHFGLRIGTTGSALTMEQSPRWDGSSSSKNKTNWEELDRPAFRRRH